jgi:hypothetical protein
LFSIAFIAVLADQIKVEFLRFGLTDYWHILFALTGIAVATAERSRLAVRTYCLSSTELLPRRPAPTTAGRSESHLAGAGS